MITSQASPPKSAAALARLAERCNLPVKEVAKLYERERGELAAVARVTTFLDVFATRNVEQILRGRNG
jgi:hypothetical protein